MCEPMMIASIALTAVTTITEYMGQQQQSDSVYEAAVASRDAQHAQLYDRAKQEEFRAGAETEKNTLRARAARSTAKTAAGETNVGGDAIDSLLRDFTMQEQSYNTTIRKNQSFVNRQLASSARGATAQAQSRVNSAPPPSFLGAAARIAGGAISAYDTFYDKPNPDDPVA